MLTLASSRRSRMVRTRPRLQARSTRRTLTSCRASLANPSSSSGPLRARAKMATPSRATPSGSAEPRAAPARVQCPLQKRSKSRSMLLESLLQRLTHRHWQKIPLTLLVYPALGAASRSSCNMSFFLSLPACCASIRGPLRMQRLHRPCSAPDRCLAQCA